MKTINYLFATIIIILLSTQISSAQDSVDTKNIWRDAVGQDFSEIQRQMEEYYTTHATGKGSGFKQWKRWENIMQDRLNLDGTVPNLAEKYVSEYQKQLSELDPSRSLTGNWENVGPNALTTGPNAYAPGLGRINCIAFHPTDANIIYIGAPAGGLWKTTDGGANWIPLFQEFSQIGVSAIVINNSSPDEVYILTGDGDGGQTLSIGVYKTTDGGVTWANTTLPWTAGTAVRGYAMKILQQTNDIITIATNVGIYQTGNGGTTWNFLIGGNFRDFEYKPNDGNRYYACTDNDVYRYNGGWELISSNIPNVNRIALAVSPDEPNSVYQVRGPGYNAGTGSNPNYKFRGLFKSTNSGASYSMMSDSPNIFGGNAMGQDSVSQSAYDMAIIANPDDASEILVGGVNLWGSTNNGVSWVNRAHWSLGLPPNSSLPYVHADIHALEINPLDDKLYCGSDGGIFVSDDFGLTWTDLSATLSISMFYRIDGIEGDSDKIIGGTQDNGTLIRSKGSSMENIWGGDGMDCKISPTNTDSVYYSAQLGSLYRSPNNGDIIQGINPSQSNGAWTTPFDLDPANASKIITGYVDTIYVSTNRGTSWNNYQPGGTGIGAFRFIYISESDSDVFACTNNRIYRSPSNVTSSSWTEITYDLAPIVAQSGVNITSITENSNGLYVTLSGSSASDKVLFLSGSTWINLTYTGLPNTSVNCIVSVFNSEANANDLYVGTDIGVYRRKVGDNFWTSFNNGIPNQSTPNTKVMDLELNETDGILYAATFGRGIWKSGLHGLCQKSEFLTQGNDTDDGDPGAQYIKSSKLIESSRVINGTSSNSVIYQAGGSQILKPGFHAKTNSFFKATLNDCTYDDPDG